MANSATERKKVAAKKDADGDLKRQPSTSAAAIREAQRQADAAATESASVDEVMRAAADRQSRVPPVLLRANAEMQSEDVDVTMHDSPRHMASHGTPEIEPRRIEPVDGPLPKDFLADLKFMEEKVLVVVHDTNEKNAAKLVQIWNDGRAQFFIRGAEQWVRRKFVEVLARSKETSYTQQNYTDAEGFDAIKNVPHTALRFPFAVIDDPNPHGRAWLRKTLSEAN